MKEASWLRDLWFSPSWIFMKYIHLLRKIRFEESRIISEGRFKKVRETLAGANLALAVQKITNQPVYVQLSKTEPPDFFLFQNTSAKDNTPWITYVEHTGHGLHYRNNKDLAVQLAATKLKYGQKYKYDFILLVEVKKIQQEDIVAITDLINQKNIGYKIWIIEGQYQNDSTSLRVVAFNSPFKEIIVDPRYESERFSASDKMPSAFRVKLGEKDLRPLAQGQLDPWPDPLG